MAAACAMFFFVLFKRPITGLIDRTRKVSKDGLEATAATQEAATEKAAEQTAIEKNPEALQKFLGQFDNSLLVERERLVMNYLSEAGIEQPTARERALVRLLAANSIIQNFERTYMLIWGSQIAAIQFLNSVGRDGIEIERLRPIYDQAVSQFPEIYKDTYSFEQWLGFVQSQQLVFRNESHVGITLMGREFLKYILHQGYGVYKNG